VAAVYSMTGFGQAAFSLNAPPENNAPATLKVAIELRSVNSRFLDLTFKLPEDLRHTEPALRELLSAQLKRGKVELRGSYESDQSASLSLDAELLRQLQVLEDKVAAHVGDNKRLGAADWMRYPGVVKNQNGAWSAESYSEAGLTAAKAAISSFLESRAREGARLVAFLIERCDALEALCVSAEGLIPEVLKRQQERFVQRWEDALEAAGAKLDAQALQERALSEAASYAIRIDVAEELSRLRSHIAEFKTLCTKGGELGKRLDFLVQEMHREANTLGSKAASLELTRVSVEMKVQIEQVREQVQNLE
jgi:uncharacterized protein (TIGR00255 family)